MQKEQFKTVEIKRDYLEKLARDFNAIYDDLYKNGGDSSELVALGDKIIKSGHPITTMLLWARNDFISSDRESAALAILCKKRRWC